MTDPRPNLVECLDGLRGTVHGAIANKPVELRLDDGRTAFVPAELFTRRADGSYAVALRRDDLAARHDLPSDAKSAAPIVVPVVDEKLRVGVERIEQARVVVHVVPQSRTEAVNVPLVEERVEVQRVAADRFVDQPEPPRQDGDVTIVPVYEEVLVLQKKLRVREEIHLRRVRTMRHEHHEVELRREEAQVNRSNVPPAEGRQSATPPGNGAA